MSIMVLVETMAERIQTFIKGFDDELDGGIPKGHITLFCGTPGTMKSSTVFSILYNNVKNNGTPCMYITLEESKEQLNGAMSELGMPVKDDMKLFTVDLGRIRLGHKEEELGKDWLNIMKQFIRKRLEEDDIQLVAIDSLGALYSLTDFTNPRQELFHFFRFLKQMGATVFMISEMSYDSPDFAKYGEDFLTDGIIQLLLKEIGETDVQLRIRCVKMRRANHNRGYLTLVQTDGGFQTTSVISQ